MKWELFREKLELLGIRERCAGVPYIVLPSRENARWLFPVVNRRSFHTGLFLYAPNTVKGHLYKACLSGIPLFFLKVWHRKRIVCLDFSGAKRFLSGMEDAPGFYVGNGGSHSKPTVQFQKGGTPVSYMKFTTDPAIEKLFKWEETALKEVKGIECADVPPVLQHTKCGCAFIFETGSVKKRVGKTDFRFSSAHEGFLLEFAAADTPVHMLMPCPVRPPSSYSSSFHGSFSMVLATSFSGSFSMMFVTSFSGSFSMRFVTSFSGSFSGSFRRGQSFRLSGGSFLTSFRTSFKARCLVREKRIVKEISVNGYGLNLI